MGGKSYFPAAGKTMNPLGPFTGPQVANIYDVLGLPPGAAGQGLSVNVIALTMYPFSNVDTWNPTFNSGSFANLITAINNQITICDPDTAAIVLIDLATWNKGVRDSEMKVRRAASGAEGQLVDDYERRRILRIRIADNLGISVPDDGYIAEIRAVYGNSLREFRQGGGGVGGLGDR